MSNRASRTLAALPIPGCGAAAVFLALQGCYGAPVSVSKLEEAAEQRDMDRMRPTLDAFSEAFSNLAASLPPVEPGDQACPADLGAADQPWISHRSVFITERALQWFATTPRTLTGDPEAPAPWTRGTEGALNFRFGERDASTSSRLEVLYELRMVEGFGATAERPISLVKSGFESEFESEHRGGPAQIVLLRDLKTVEPRLSNSADLDPEAGAELFSAGAMSGVFEIYDAAKGQRLCSRRISAQSSSEVLTFEPLTSDALSDDLAGNFVRTADEAFARPIVGHPAPAQE